MRILVVEDDIKLSAFIVNGLKQAGFAVDSALDGDEGLRLALNEPYDAAIIDVMLPKRDGLSVIEELRRQKITTPVIILSAKRSVDDRIKGLQIGSDDKRRATRMKRGRRVRQIDKPSSRYILAHG